MRTIGIVLTVMCAFGQMPSKAEQPKRQARVMTVTHAALNSLTRAKRITIEDGEYSCELVCHADMPFCGWPKIGEKYTWRKEPPYVDPDDTWHRWSSQYCLDPEIIRSLTGVRSGQVIKGCSAGCMKQCYDLGKYCAEKIK